MNNFLISSLAVPTEATLFLTDKCNFRCEGCKRQVEGVDIYEEMTLETVKQLLKVYPSIHGVCLAGLGEPTLCSNFGEIVNYLIDAGKYVGIISNGSNAESLINLEKKPDYLSISLYGYDRNSYIESVKLDIFDTVMNNFSLLRNNFKSIGFSYFINKQNYKQLSKIINIAHKEKADFLHITNYLAYDISDKEEIEKIITVNDKEIIAEIDVLLSQLDLPGARPVYVDHDNYIFNCPSYGLLINVNGAGDISACQRQIAPSPDFGNVFDDKDWYNDGEIQECRSKIKYGKYPHDNCRYCFGKMGRTQSSNLSIGIYILFHEKVDQTIECINSFISFGIPIYILNNGSSQQSTSKILDHIKDYSHVCILSAEKNLGVGVGRNYLIENTKEDWLFFVDNDITIQSINIIEKVINHIKNNNDIEVFIPRLYNVHEDSFVNFIDIGIDDNRVNFKEMSNDKTNYFPGGASIVSRQVFQRCGLYDEKMFVGLEDMELALRAIVTGEPIKCKLIEDIILYHNHKTVTHSDDKRAVITRYDMSIQEKSYRRILEKYPNLKFDHSYQAWVIEQQTKMTRSSEIDLTFLTPLTNFGAGTLRRFHVDIFQYSLDEEIIKELVEVSRNFYQELTNFKFIGFGAYAQRIKNEFSTAQFYDSSSTLKTDLSILLDTEVYSDLEKWENTFSGDNGSSILVINILERLYDPRPLLYSLRNLLIAGHKCLLIVDEKISSSDKTKQGAYWRQWTISEIKILLLSSGFTIAKSVKSNCVTSFSFIEIQATHSDYELFLNSIYLPPPSMEYLVVSQEHSEAVITGGIGSYVGELEQVVPSKFFGLMLIGSGEFLPDQYRCKQKKYFCLSNFIADSTANLKLEDAVSLALEVVIYLYNCLKVIEFQDVNGKGYKFLQGKNSGLYPTKLMTQVVCHASRVSLEKTFKIWIDPSDRELLEEKFVIENTDIIKLPTDYIGNYYKDVGYAICNSKLRYERLPFTYTNANGCCYEGEFENIDTLIFFGKRNSYKGFDIFANIVRKMIDRGKEISRILLIGPRCEEMQEYNSYFDEVSARGIIVEEHSLKRDDALNLIAANAPRSICIIPYLADNHPYSVLEIINSFCPFVATSTGGIPELIPTQYSQDVLCRPKPEYLIECIDRWLLRTSTDRKVMIERLRNAAICDQDLINKSIYPKLMDIYSAWHEKKNRKNNAQNERGVSCLVVLENNNEGLYSILHMIRQQTQPPEKVIFLKRKSCTPQELLEASDLVDSIGDSKYVILLLDCEYDGELLNEGLRHVTTNFVVTFHSSIMISSTCISSYLRRMEFDLTCDYVTSYSGIYTSEESAGLFPDKIDSYLGEGIFMSQINNLLGHPYGLYRTERLRQCNGFVCSDEIYRGGWATIMRLVSRGYRVGIIPRPEVCIPSNNEPYGDKYSDQHLLAIETFGLGRFESFRLQSIARWLSLQRDENAKLFNENIKQLNYIHELEGLINGHTNSLSWKLTKPLRFGKRLIKRVLQ